MRKALVSTCVALLWTALAGCGGDWFSPDPIPTVIELSTDTLAFGATEGGANPAPQDVFLTNSAAGTMSWTASCDQPWLQVLPPSGTTTTETDTLTVFAVIARPEVWLGPTSTSGAPQARHMHCAVWTGAEMIVWGGGGGGGFKLNTGDRYDPATDAWLGPISTDGAPSARWHATAVWTGSAMVVWGGMDAGAQRLNTGGRYDPVTDTWLGATSTVGAPAPRMIHSAAWTGSEMIVWGGYDITSFSTGGRYDPAADQWLGATSTDGAPLPRYDHSAVWTGSEMIVWGGDSPTNTGARYDPATDTWLGPTSTSAAPAARWGHMAVWTGSQMVVWGGNGGGGQLDQLDTGALYDPMTDTWLGATATAGNPGARRQHSAVWTGTEMIVWGGYHGGDLNTGGRYCPPISLSAGTYNATVTVSAPNASNSPQVIYVNLTVAPP